MYDGNDPIEHDIEKCSRFKRTRESFQNLYPSKQEPVSRVHNPPDPKELSYCNDNVPFKAFFEHLKLIRSRLDHRRAIA